MNNITKRDFLKASAAFGLGSAANVFSSFEALAQTAQTEDYRALVCVFMFGGNDANNMLIPTDSTAYSRYAAARSNLALPASSLLQIAPSNTTAKFGLHPAMTGIANLFNGSPPPRRNGKRALCRCLITCFRILISNPSGNPPNTSAPPTAGAAAWLSA
jgi:uncharacterized protein (DUF1501 family)